MVKSARFKLDGANYFLQLASTSHGDPAEFRYLFDGASEAIVSARCLIWEAIGGDSGLEAKFEENLDGSLPYQIVKAIRNDSHHHGKRALLTDEVSGNFPILVARAVVGPEDYNSRAVIDPNAKPGMTSRKWTIEFNGDRYDALEKCRESIDLFRRFLTEEMADGEKEG